jgi:hypothetical protein
MPVLFYYVADVTKESVRVVLTKMPYCSSLGSLSFSSSFQYICGTSFPRRTGKSTQHPHTVGTRFFILLSHSRIFYFKTFPAVCQTPLKSYFCENDATPPRAEKKHCCIRPLVLGTAHTNLFFFTKGMPVFDATTSGRHRTVAGGR